MAFMYRGGPTSPPNEPATAYTNPLSPPRNQNRLSGGMVSTDIRGGLTRRFTTNALPTLSPIGLQRKQAAGDYASESAVRRYETLLAAQRELQRELDKVDPETRREVEEGLRHEDSITQMMASSEPASPPGYGNAFPSAFSRPNRYSMNSLTSPPGIATRPNRSSTQLTSPSSSLVRPYTSGNVTASATPSHSVPSSRRQSDDEDEDDFVYGYDTIHRAAANPNRNSMPITSYDRKRNGISSILGSASSSSFLFDGEDDRPIHRQSKSTTTSPPDAKNLLHYTADGFPKLIRREENGELSSAALDLAFLQGVEPQQPVADRNTTSRHRISLPQSAISGNVSIAPLNSILAKADNKVAQPNRRSVEVKFSAETKRPTLLTTPPRAPNGQKPLSSYSTNDLPTLKTMTAETSNSSGEYSGHAPSVQPSHVNQPTSPEHGTSAQHVRGNSQHQNQDFGLMPMGEDNQQPFINGFASQASALQANAAPFGPMAFNQDNQLHSFAPAMLSPYSQAQYYGAGYNMPVLAGAFANMNLNGGFSVGQGQWPHLPVYPQQNGYGAFQHFQQPGGPVTAAPRFGDSNGYTNGTSQPRVTQAQRRDANSEAQKLYNSISVDQLPGQIYRLCKDQHGCRFLQRKLDEQSDNTTKLIFEEVKEHIIELMTDPFGNYLCQKLLESTNDDQRTVLINNASPAMTKIALNQHGTRALQKMIEFITTPEQTQLIRQALQNDVVQLIQDLNGNHVIQKCLNHLTPTDAEFIFVAVGRNCVTVGTHRHGCCVLQRCIDHASGLQKGALVDAVIENAFALVQDPFGNYVVQYILDLSEPSFTEPLCASFLGNMAVLSKQKFSSNVIEKCIRCAGGTVKRDLIQEIMEPNELEILLRDSFANYVVQTAMDYGDEETKSLLIDSIRPILPAIRHTPYGRRIQGKIQEYDARNSGLSSGIATPHDSTTSPNGLFPTSPVSKVPITTASAPVGRGNRQGWVGPSPQYGTDFAGTGFSSYSGTSNDSSASDVASPSTKRHNQSSNMFPDTQFGGSGPTFFDLSQDELRFRTAPHCYDKCSAFCLSLPRPTLAYLRGTYFAYATEALVSLLQLKDLVSPPRSTLQRNALQADARSKCISFVFDTRFNDSHWILQMSPNYGLLASQNSTLSHHQLDVVTMDPDVVTTS
nr:pumilio domain-containing protein c6g9.14 [Quercus suber]